MLLMDWQVQIEFLSSCRGASGGIKPSETLIRGKNSNDKYEWIDQVRQEQIVTGCYGPVVIGIKYFNVTN